MVLTVGVVLSLAGWLAIAYEGNSPHLGNELAVLPGPRGVEASAVQSELASASDRRAAALDGRFFDLAERPKGAHLMVSYGEQVIPIETSTRDKTNPWWKSVRVWRDGSVKPTKRQKMVLVTGLPRSGTTLMDVFLRLFDRELSTLPYPKNNHNHEGVDLIPPQELPLSGYGGSGGGYVNMCGAQNGKFKRSNVRLNEQNTTLAQQMQKVTWKYWRPKFNLSMPALFEKYPGHLLRMRMWQSMFADTHDVFPIFTVKHPLESITSVSCNPADRTRKVMVENWLNCHRALLEDLKHIRNYLVVPYEAWFLYPDDTARAIETYLNLEIRVNVSMPTRRLIVHGERFVLQKKYFGRCNKEVRKFHKSEMAKNWPGERYKAELATYGYDLYDTTVIHKPSAFGLCKLDGAPCP